MGKLRQYELTTSENDPFGMPHQIFAKSRRMALRQIKRKRRKREKITSLKRSYWPRKGKGWFRESHRHSIAAKKGKRKRVYSRGSWQLAIPSRKRCMFCGKYTTRRIQGSTPVCSACAKRRKL